MSAAEFLLLLLLAVALLRPPSPRPGGELKAPGVLLRPGLRVRVEELKGPFAPHPRPLENGFSPGREYDVWGVYNPSETAEAYALLVNDRDELWFIPTRHLRAAGECRPGAPQS